ncbi:MAG: hypothetical protein LBF62_14850 [Tannerellaceae bacterium]|jgi:hypothetical protein|nr:hypothetical protein [Tannerellaceae bacterium]
MENSRQDNELPQCYTEWGWQYHHLGIPTTEKRKDESYLPQFKLYVSGFPSSPFGVEWMRYEPDSPIDERVRARPHIAFVVNDLDYELAIRPVEVITPPNLPSDGLRVAMVAHDGAVIELMEFSKSNKR